MGSVLTKFKINCEYDRIKGITSLKKEEIDYLRKKFNKACEGKQSLNKEQFIQLYISLRNEPPSNLNAIANFIYKAFDINSDGFIHFTLLIFKFDIIEILIF